jgi:hypothetical protein
MEKAFVVQRGATKLFATERSVDTAISDAAELMALLVQSKRDVNASSVVGDQAFVKLAEAISALSAARTAMVECHNELAEVKLRLGVRTKMIGGETNKDFDRQIGHADHRSVAEA